MNKNSHLVYSSNPVLNQKCPQCKEVLSECVCAPAVDVNPKDITAVLRMEKAGRGGKTVTVIDQLPKSETFLKDLCSDLKKKCGSGGTYFVEKSGVIEIQGDKRDILRKELPKKSIKVKG